MEREREGGREGGRERAYTRSRACVGCHLSNPGTSRNKNGLKTGLTTPLSPMRGTDLDGHLGHRLGEDRMVRQFGWRTSRRWAWGRRRTRPRMNGPTAHPPKKALFATDDCNGCTVSPPMGARPGTPHSPTKHSLGRVEPRDSGREVLLSVWPSLKLGADPATGSCRTSSGGGAGARPQGEARRDEADPVGGRA